MCGIIGLMTKSFPATNDHIKKLSHLLVLDQLRGEHATGVAKINRVTNKVSILKKAESAIEFLDSKEALEFLDKDRCHIYIGHNRYATMGARDDDDNAHPFQEDHITMVHNGTVDKWTLDKLEDHKDTVVDSHMVAKTIAKRGIAEAVKSLHGAFSLVWWDSKERSINFLRNEERPMFIAHLDDGTMMWASEKEFIEVLINREKNLKIKEIYATTPHNHIRWEFSEAGTILHDAKAIVTEMKFTKVPDPSPLPVTRYGNWSGFYGRGGDDLDDYMTEFYGDRGSRGGKVERIQQVSADGCMLGTKDNVNRCDNLLKQWGTHWRMGERPLVQFHSFEPDARQKDGQVGTLNLVMKTMKDTEIYFREYGARIEDYYTSDGKMAQEFRGTITNAYECICSIGGKQGSHKVGKLAKINPILRRTVDTPVKVEDKKVAFVSYPLKVYGHTFRTAHEFTDFVSNKGCYCCGDIPLPYDQENLDISVINNGEDFICGTCAEEMTAGQPTSIEK